MRAIRQVLPTLLVLATAPLVALWPLPRVWGSAILVMPGQESAEENVELSLSSSDRLIALARQHGFPTYVGIGTMFRGWARGMRGKQGAVEEICEGFRTWSGNDTGLATTLRAVLLVQVLHALGRWDEAEDEPNRALALARAHRELLYLAVLTKLQAVALVRQGRRAEAIAILRGLGAEATAKHNLMGRIEALTLLASLDPAQDEINALRALLAQVRCGGALPLLTRARRALETLGPDAPAAPATPPG